MDKHVITYIDKRPIVIPYLTYYRNGVSLPNDKNEITVTGNEKKKLMKLLNGTKPCFEAKAVKKQVEKIEEE